MTHRRPPSTLLGRMALLILVGLSILTPMQTTLAQDAAKPKLLVLTDIGGDPDDQQAMIRLMVHSNEFQITGLIATSRLGHGQDTQPGLITQIVNAYGSAYNNLQQHAAGFVPAQQMLDVVKSGSPNSGTNYIDVGTISAGAQHIIDVVDAASPTDPINITIWGGATDLAQALNRVKNTRSAAEANQFISHIRVNAIYDQDGTGAWIQQQFPQLWYIHDTDFPGVGQSAPARGMYQNDTRRQTNTSLGWRVAPAEYTNAEKDAWDQQVKLAWVQANIHGHGSLGDLYPTNVWQGPTGGSWPHNGTTGVKEGDTPSWFYFLPNGLSVPDHPEFGGWGGRYEQDDPGKPFFTPDADVHATAPTDQVLGQVWTVARWRDAYQREFQARMDWVTAATYEQANHAPVSPLEGLYTYTEVTVGDDQEVTLPGVAAGWSDPDGDELSYRWWFYADPSTSGVMPTLIDPSAVDLSLLIPEVDAVAQLHLILEVTDQPTSGGVAMTRYQRVLLTIDPNHVPEPTTLASLGLAGFMLLPRRGHFRGRGRQSIKRSGNPRC